MQELTVKQISERLGYDVKIVKETPPEIFYKVGDWFQLRSGILARILRVDNFDSRGSGYMVGLFRNDSWEATHHHQKVDDLGKIPWSVVQSLTLDSYGMKKVNVKVVKEIS